jgi:carbon-monoxide dehydrogenase medium subunit
VSGQHNELSWRPNLSRSLPKENPSEPFAYQTPKNVADAVKLVTGEARLIAGGQSLLPSMKLGLAAPSALIDLGQIAELRSIKVEGGKVTIGAMATHASVGESAELKKALPALAELARNIGDRQVRNRGTIGGSLANNDPAACYPAAALGLGATIHTDRRTIAADDFFKGLYETALAPGEIITAVSFPIPERAKYVKFKQPASRFSLVGVFVSKGPGGTRVAVTGAGATVFRVKALEDKLAVKWAAESCVGVTVSADQLNSDLHGSAAYRAALIPVLAQRAVAAS